MAPAIDKTPASRVRSIDILRGVVMVLMAIDHVRVYSGLPAGGPTAGIFFTRWITHFCAPAFAFFAGTSAFLYGRKLDNPASLARHLITRGLLLVLLELTLIRFTWTFNFKYNEFVLAGVIWMLGWCMVLLAGLVALPARTVGVIGLVIIFFQQVFRILPKAAPQAIQDSIGWVWEFVYPAGFHRWNGMSILYVLVPWIGVMAAGYGFGVLLVRKPEERRRLCLGIGLTATLLFLAIGIAFIAINGNGDDTRPFLFRLLDQQKYPASQLFLMMTLGPTIALLPLMERAHARFTDVLATFGRVPMIYYLLHIPAIHLAALAVNFLRDGSVHPEWYSSAPYSQVPASHRWGLPLLYLVFAIVVSGLYFACRWFADFKARRSGGWLRYL